MIAPRILTAALAATALSLSGAAMADANPPPMIAVTGEATVNAVPDLARIDGGVTTDAKTAREASDANNATMGRVLLALQGAGLAEKDYQTSRLSLSPQYVNAGPNRNGPPVVSGYRASNRVTVRLREVSKVASIIDALVAAGANDIGGINFSVSNPSKLLDEARPRAIADARRKAEIYAKAAGVTLGDPLSISEGGVALPMPMARRASMDFAAAPVAPGEETLHIHVSVSWAIKPAGQ
ncbi:MAG: SIMPL domain-containing protein [Xanthobacteraceae bacterium]|nr:SIMPL domain-containing protein [Xanthobacteraceae bacterium]